MIQQYQQQHAATSTTSNLSTTLQSQQSSSQLTSQPPTKQHSRSSSTSASSEIGTHRRNPSAGGTNTLAHHHYAHHQFSSAEFEDAVNNRSQAQWTSGILGLLTEGGSDEHLNNDMSPGSTPMTPPLSVSHNLKPLLIEGIKELIEELEHIHPNIGVQSLEHIHSNEIILTLGKSRTVENFLKYAAKTRRFQVIVAETSPVYSGHEMAVSLASAGIETTLIPDAAIFAVMSRVNKVILGCHAVMANGGIIAACGSHIVANAAKHHSTPVVVCSGMYKLSPLYPYDTDVLNLMLGPDPVYKYEDGDIIEKVEVSNPYYDYVPPDLVNLFITNV